MHNDITNKHHGSCLCGAIKFEINGEFERFYLCHCTHCRKDTGAAHAANLFSGSAKVNWLMGEDKVQSFTLPSTRHSRSFCSVCGSALPNVQMSGALLVVPAGCLDSALAIRPTAHIFISSKAAWDTELENVPTFYQLP